MMGNDGILVECDEEIDRVARWIVANKIVTLNVAGNSSSTAPGIEPFACWFMSEVIKDVQSLEHGEIRVK